MVGLKDRRRCGSVFIAASMFIGCAFPFVPARAAGAGSTSPATFYFAEGTTRAGFQEYLCLGNPGSRDAVARATYMFADGSAREASYPVPANSRCTVDVNGEVGPGKDVSVRIRSGTPGLVAERPIYFNYKGIWTGGSCAPGAVAPDTRWFFAEGNTLPEFDQYVTVLNPGPDEARLVFHYMVEGEGEKNVAGKVGPRSRATFKTRDQIGAGKHASLLLESTRGVVAERPMYFDYRGLAGNNWTGGHDVVGANSPGREWYFAEGTTRRNPLDGAFEQWLCLQNPGAVPLVVTATYQTAVGQGGPVSRKYTVPARERVTISVNREVGPDRDCGIHLESPQGFIAERPVYFDYHNAWTGGHSVPGISSAATDWFLAEGTTRVDFEEWLCLQNPGDTEARVTVSYLTAGARVIARQKTVSANSRLTVSVNSDVGEGQDVSALVSSDRPIVVERSMYFDYNGWSGGHDAVGFALAGGVDPVPGTAPDVLHMDGTPSVRDLAHDIPATLSGTPRTAPLKGAVAPVVGPGAYGSCSWPSASLGMTPGMPFTAVCVVNSSAAHDDGVPHLMLMNRDGIASTYGWELLKTAYGLVAIGTWSHGSAVWTAIECNASNWAAGTDHVVIATVDEDNNQRIFLDGVEGFLHSTTSSPREEAIGPDLYVGVHDDGIFPLQGSILAAIYKRILSDEEIASLGRMTDWSKGVLLGRPGAASPSSARSASGFNRRGDRAASTLVNPFRPDLATWFPACAINK